MPDISTITTGGVTYNIKDVVARLVNGIILTLNIGATTTLPVTVSNPGITSDMVVLSATFSNPQAVTSNMTWTTADGVLTLAGTINGSTTIQIVLGKSAF